MLVVGQGGTAILDENDLEIEHHGVARGGFAAHVGLGARVVNFIQLDVLRCWSM